MLQQQTLSSHNAGEGRQMLFPPTVNLLMPIHRISKIISLLTYLKTPSILPILQNWHKGFGLQATN